MIAHVLWKQNNRYLTNTVFTLYVLHSFYRKKQLNDDGKTRLMPGVTFIKYYHISKLKYSTCQSTMCVGTYRNLEDVKSKQFEIN